MRSPGRRMRARKRGWYSMKALQGWVGEQKPPCKCLVRGGGEYVQSLQGLGLDLWNWQNFFFSEHPLWIPLPIAWSSWYAACSQYEAFPWDDPRDAMKQEKVNQFPKHLRGNIKNNMQNKQESTDLSGQLLGTIHEKALSPVAQLSTRSGVFPPWYFPLTS